jgi:hypothetical protein
MQIWIKFHIIFLFSCAGNMDCLLYLYPVVDQRFSSNLGAL